MTSSKLYYEAHVTIEPVFDDNRLEAGRIAEKYGFKLAHLLMQKREMDTAERSKYDTFMTGHGVLLVDMKDRVTGLVKELRDAGFKVWRAKIEDTIMDTRTEDVWGLLA